MGPPNHDSTSPADGTSSLRDRAADALTRRRLLVAGGGIVGAGALAQVRTDPPEPVAVPDGVWPFADRDSARTSAAPSATPPAEPDVAWRREPVPLVTSLVVGPERIYVGSGARPTEAPRVAALDRTDGTVRWTRRAPGACLAYADGSVFATGANAGESSGRADDRPRGSVARLDADTGETRWRRPVRDAGESLLVTRRAVHVGFRDGLDAFGRRQGRLLFRARLRGAPAVPLLADGSLVVAGGSVDRYPRRKWGDVLLKRLSAPAWSRDLTGYAVDPTVLGGGTDGSAVATGSFFSDDGDALHSHALADGTRRWRAIDAGDLPEPTVAKELAADGDRLFYGLRTGSDADRSRALVCRDAATGAARWREALPNWLREVVVAGDLVLAGTRLDAVASGSGDVPDGDGGSETPPPGRVTAFSRAGEVRWRRPVGGPVSQVVPVGDRVFVGTDDVDYGGRSGVAGRVVALE